MQGPNKTTSLAIGLILTLGASIRSASAESPADSQSNRVVPYVGVAIAPNGQAAKAAQVAVIGEQSAMITADARIESGSVTADEDGSFAAMPYAKANTLLIVHDSGIAAVPLAGWRDPAKIRLQPWADPKGRMSINNVPAPNKGLVASIVKFPAAPGLVQLLNFETQTDAAGNFRFDRLPPGEVTLFWKIPTGPERFAYSHGQLFAVDSSAQTDMKYNLRGRTIRAEAVIPKDGFDGNGSPLIAYLRPRPTEFDPLGVPTFESRFVLNLDNGKIACEAVPPGTYKLFVRPLFTTVDWMLWSADLVVTSGVDPIDFGRIAMTNNVREFPTQ